MVKKILKWTGLVLGVLVLAAFIFLWWGSGGDSDDALISPGEILAIPNAAPAQAAPPATLTAIAFNIAYGRGPEGDGTGPWTEEYIRTNLDRIATIIADSGADVAALQEVDLGASRTYGIHEGRYLAERLGFHASCVITWEKNYVPFPYWPPSKHYGQMRSGQCVLSRWPITATTRYRLEQPESNPWWRNAFYLHRAIQHAVITPSEGQTLDVYNVHLDAFDMPNRTSQAAVLARLVDGAPSARALMIGDFNAPPADAERLTGFVDEPDADFTGDTTIATVSAVKGAREVLPSEPAHTFPSVFPNRRLDYIFYRGALEQRDARVLTDPAPPSDHLPVVATFAWLPVPVN